MALRRGKTTNDFVRRPPAGREPANRGGSVRRDDTAWFGDDEDYEDEEEDEEEEEE